MTFRLYSRILSVIIMVLFPVSLLNGQGISSNIPSKVDSTKKYLFYLHGRIIEEKGTRPAHPRFGIYEYGKILKTFADSGFTVISEARKKNTNPLEYAKKVVSQIDTLLRKGINPANISVLGASKGAAIAVFVSGLLKNEQVHFIILAICNPSMASYWETNNIQLWGRVLYIHDRSDGIAGSCQPYMKTLRSKGLKEYKEIELNLGLGHGFLYRPYPQWVKPAVDWAKK